MNTSLAWHNLLHKKFRTGVAIAGITFAIVLMFMQLGFLEAVKASATVSYDMLNFDVCIRSNDYLHVGDPRSFPRERLAQVTSVRGVEHAMVLQIANNSFRNPLNGDVRAMLCWATDPDAPAFRDPQLQRKVRELLQRPDAMLIDTSTRKEFGPQDQKRFGPRDHGVTVKINEQPVRIVGDYDGGIGLASNGNAIMSERGLLQVTPWFSEDMISLGLLELAEGVDPEQFAQQLQDELPEDVDVKSRQQVMQSEVNFWVFETNYGLILQTGVVVALIVGTAIVYQVLVSDVANMLPEFATLKAIGYSNRYLGGVILQQAVALAICSYGVGIVIAKILYWITSQGAQIPVRMTWTNAFLVLALSLFMCVGSGLGAARKAFRADPADLF